LISVAGKYVIEEITVKLFLTSPRFPLTKNRSFIIATEQINGE
jgi:hypothetical protein